MPPASVMPELCVRLLGATIFRTPLLTVVHGGPSGLDFTPARILDGRPLAARIRAGVRRQSAAFERTYGFRPLLAAVMVGHQAASSVYVQQIMRACSAVGIPSRAVELPRRTTADEAAPACTTVIHPAGALR